VDLVSADCLGLGPSVPDGCVVFHELQRLSHCPHRLAPRTGAPCSPAVPQSGRSSTGDLLAFALP
jgi:hypothetical protein